MNSKYVYLKKLFCLVFPVNLYKTELSKRLLSSDCESVWRWRCTKILIFSFEHFRAEIILKLV